METTEMLIGGSAGPLNMGQENGDPGNCGKQDCARLHKKHIENGHYRSMNGLCIDILSGAKNERIKIATK